MSDIGFETGHIWYGKDCQVTIPLTTTVRPGTFPGLDIRSELIINRPDEYGFRSMSPYSRTVVKLIRRPELSYTALLPPRHACGRYSTEAYVKGSIGTGSWTSFSLWAPRQQQNLFVTRSLNDLKDQRIQMMMTLAFTGQTSSMIRLRALQMYRVLKDLRSGNIKEAHRKLKRFLPSNAKISSAQRKRAVALVGKKGAGLYLEILFGWLQLYRDILGAYEELVEKSNRPRHSLITGRSGSNESSISTGEWQQSNQSDGFDRLCELRLIDAHNVGHKAVSVMRVDSAVLMRSASLGFTNPLELLWDVIPFSWVVDQVIGIGQSLSTIDATVGGVYLGTSYTRYRKTYRTVELRSAAKYQVREGEFYNDGIVDMCHMERKVVKQSYVPPVIKNPFDGDVKLAVAAVAALAVNPLTTKMNKQYNDRIRSFAKFGSRGA